MLRYPIVSFFIKTQNGFTFVVLAYLDFPRKKAVEWVSA